MPMRPNKISFSTKAVTRLTLKLARFRFQSIGNFSTTQTHTPQSANTIPHNPTSNPIVARLIPNLVQSKTDNLTTKPNYPYYWQRRENKDRGCYDDRREQTIFESVARWLKGRKTANQSPMLTSKITRGSDCLLLAGLSFQAN